MLYSPIILALSIIISHIAYTHPVTFKGGTGIWTHLAEDTQHVAANYSWHRQWALELDYLRATAKNETTHYSWAQINHLLQRWNLPDAQANAYLSLGGGTATNTSTTALGAVAAQLDYETRRIYTALRHRSLIARDATQHHTTMSLGIAPYLANYHDLNTWIIAHTTYQPHMDKTFVVKPGLRFFYKKVFWELGSSLQGDWFAMAMVHF